MNDFIVVEIHQIYDHSGQQSGHESTVCIKDRLSNAKLYWMMKDVSGVVEFISEAQLALNFGKMQDNNKIVNMIVSGDNKYFVLYI